VKSLKRILVGTDNSDSAHRAVEAAAHLAKQVGASLIIVNVEQGYFDHSLGPFDSHEGTVDMLEARSREILSRAKDEAERIGIPPVQTISGLGDAAAFILDVAKREAVDLIVLGKRGRSRLAGILLGSVSQHVAALAPCSVQIIP
jgi:nucleotide-binding universal stress UspA family protein